MEPAGNPGWFTVRRSYAFTKNYGMAASRSNSHNAAVDLTIFANRIRPLLDELEGEPPERLASLITAAVIASPLSSDDLVAAFLVASKALTEYAGEGWELKAPGGSPTIN